MCASSSDSVADVFVAIDENVTKIVVQAELQETVARAGDCPTVFVVVVDDQATRFSRYLEFAIVIGVTATAVLNTVGVDEVMNHFMQQCGANFFDGAGKGASSNVDLMGGAFLADPGIIPQGEMPVSFGRGLNRDRRS